MHVCTHVCLTKKEMLSNCARNLSILPSATGITNLNECVTSQMLLYLFSQHAFFYFMTNLLRWPQINGFHISICT